MLGADSAEWEPPNSPPVDPLAVLAVDGGEGAGLGSWLGTRVLSGPANSLGAGVVSLPRTGVAGAGAGGSPGVLVADGGSGVRSGVG